MGQRAADLVNGLFSNPSNDTLELIISIGTVHNASVDQAVAQGQAFSTKLTTGEKKILVIATDRMFRSTGLLSGLNMSSLR